MMAASNATKLHLEVTKGRATRPQALFWVNLLQVGMGFVVPGRQRAGDAAGSLTTHGVTPGLQG